MPSAESQNAPDDNKPKTYFLTTLKLLTNVAHASSPFIVTFLLIHLSSPVLANVGGTELASQTMLLGREYYQTHFGEKYLVLGPIVVHSIAGITKRLLAATSNLRSSSGSSTPPSTSSLRPFTSLLSITGHTTALLLLPIHYLVHRQYPAIPSEPIHAVGPSSLDYEYVKFGLHNWPWQSWFLYGGLVTAVSLHAVDGAGIIWDTWIRGSLQSVWRQTSKRTKRWIVIGGAVLPVLAGLISVAKEPLMIFSSTARRYEAAYMTSYIFRT